MEENKKPIIEIIELNSKDIIVTSDDLPIKPFDETPN